MEKARHGKDDEGECWWKVCLIRPHLKRDLGERRHREKWGRNKLGNGSRDPDGSCWLHLILGAMSPSFPVSVHFPLSQIVLILLLANFATQSKSWCPSMINLVSMGLKDHICWKNLFAYHGPLFPIHRSLPDYKWLYVRSDTVLFFFFRVLFFIIIVLAISFLSFIYFSPNYFY